MAAAVRGDRRGIRDTVAESLCVHVGTRTPAERDASAGGADELLRDGCVRAREAGTSDKSNPALGGCR